MATLRLAPRLDIKGENLIKSINLEGLRVVGDPHDFAVRYYEQGADELIYMDCVASLYQRNNLAEIISKTVKDVFIPITVGGGIRSVEDVRKILRAGADKVAVNTAAIERPELLAEIANMFGSQCLVLSVEVKSLGKGVWEAYTDNGRERTGRKVQDWIAQGIELGVGEVMLTSVDREGTRKGFDLEMIKNVAQDINIPLIASGGMGNIRHLYELLELGLIDAVAMADVLHYCRYTLPEIRDGLLEKGFNLRRVR